MENNPPTAQEIEDCRIRIEKAIETFYLDWFFNHKEFFNKDFSYSIEPVNVNGQKYIRFSYGSKEYRMRKYIGKLEPALRAIMNVRNNLCDTASQNLAQILRTCERNCCFLDYTLNPAFIGGERENIMDFKFIKDSLIEKIKIIKPIASPVMECDIDNLLGFFIDEYPIPSIYCKPLSIEISLTSKADFLTKLDAELPKVLPVNSNYSFEVEKSLGRYIWGRFMERPYKIYFDINWKEDSYKLRILNIAGFEKNSRKADINGLAFSMKLD